MADDGNDVGVLDRQVATPVLIGEVGAEEGREVGPELVEGGHAGRSTLAEAESTRAGRLKEASAGG